MPRQKKPRTMEFYIKRALRKIWGWDPNRKQAKVRAQLKPRRAGFELYQCEKCGEAPLARQDVEIDHIVPVGSFDGDWTGYINRLFCPPEGLQVLCKAKCHRAKTDNEATARAKARKE